MRIDAYNQISQLYQTQQSVKMDRQTKTQSRDEIQISQKAKDHQVAKEAVRNAPDVRMDLVNSIKARMDAGTYEVSNDAFAQKLVERYEGQQLYF